MAKQCVEKSRCRNCGGKFHKGEDPYYKLCVVHDTACCPYRFLAAAHTLKQLRKNIQGILDNQR